MVDFLNSPPEGKKKANFHMGLGVFTEQHFQLKNVKAIMFVILRRTTDRNAVGVP